MATTKLKRRAKGSGSIYQRPDGAWIGEVTLAGHRRRVTAPSAELAEFRLRSLANGRLPNYGDGTVGGYLRVHLDWLESNNKVRPSTLLAYRRIVAHHLLPDLGKVALSELRPGHVKALVTRLYKAGLKPSTILNVRNVLSGAMEQARKDDLISTNPARVDVERSDYGSKARAERALFIFILEAVQGHRYEDLYNLIAYTGVRSGEALALDWRQVDLGRGLLTIKHTVTRTPDSNNGFVGRHHIGPPKGGRREGRERVLPIPEELAGRLRQRWYRMGRPTAGFVFPSARDASKPVDQSHALHRFQAALRAANLEPTLRLAGFDPMRLHDLRHLYATWQIGKGTDISTVAKLLGHSTSATTLRFYTGETLGADRVAASHMSFEGSPLAAEKERQDRARRARRRSSTVLSRPEDRADGWGDTPPT